jgi:hypothetical protein
MISILLAYATENFPIPAILSLVLVGRFGRETLRRDSREFEPLAGASADDAG